MTARPGERDERGAVLVVVVLLVLAGIGLSQGTLLAALFQLRAARSGARLLEVTVAAEGALTLALNRGGEPWMDSVGNWAVGPSVPAVLGRARTTTVLRRLAPESWLLEARAELDDGPGTSAARLVWILDPVERVAALPAVLVVGAGGVTSLAGPVENGAVTSAESPDDDDLCEPWMARLRSGFPGDSVGEVRVVTDSLGWPGLGDLDFARLTALGEASDDSVGAPQPVERFGACVTEEPWNWGDPESPARPCGAYLPLRFFDRDLHLVGGVGQGVLLVDGELWLDAGARYYGLVMTTGQLRLTGGAELTGFAIARGGVAIASDARVTGSACRATRALAANRSILSLPVARGEPVGPLG